LESAPTTCRRPSESTKMPMKIPTVCRPLSGQATRATPAAAAITPAPTFDMRPLPSSDGVMASAAPWRMKSTPTKVPRLSTDQSMVRMSAPKTIELMPAKRKIPQCREASSASARPKCVRLLSGFINTGGPPL
jgi:hypothetical protein